MGFFDVIGTTADIIGIADPIMSKLKSEKSDYRNFIASIEKVVKAGCKVYRDFLTASPDHKDIDFPDVYDTMLCSAVVSAIEADVEFTLQMILPNETDFPSSEKKRLFEMISVRLKHHSLEYLIREQFVQDNNVHKEQLANLKSIMDSLGKIEKSLIINDINEEDVGKDQMKELDLPYDVHSELVNKFEELFGDNNNHDDDDEKNNSLDNFGKQLIDLQATNLKKSIPLNKKNSMRITNPDKMMGRHFSWINPTGVRTLIFEVTRLLF